MKSNFVIIALIVTTCLAIPFSAIGEKVGGGDLTFTPKNASPVIFSHDKHVNGQGLRCSVCHYKIFQMAQGSNKMDMSKITKGEFCGKCHNGQNGFDVKDQKNCTRCHK
jgi:c(7)-type cytochrome triheme protein